MNHAPTHLDLFSGIGGFSLAAEAAGFKTVAFSEINPWASAVLRKHWPDVPNLGDIRKLADWPDLGRIDLLTGGFPCQPHSFAGERRGKADDRYLWPAMLAAFKRFRPLAGICENVPGIVGMELDGVLDDMESLGYAVQPFAIPACAVRAFQKRMRIWIVAYHESFAAQKQVLEKAARPVFKLGGPASPLSGYLWQPHRKTYLSDMVGEVHGLSDWVDRSIALGNTIVPQVAEIFCKAIYNQLTR